LLDWRAQETGTALGYLALFLHLAAHYLDGPLLHVIGFQACTLSSPLVAHQAMPCQCRVPHVLAQVFWALPKSPQ
jgi:hypothetical protein